MQSPVSHGRVSGAASGKVDPFSQLGDFSLMFDRSCRMAGVIEDQKNRLRPRVLGNPRCVCISHFEMDSP